MRVVLSFVFIICILNSCKKETFVPCSGLEELYGEWKGIDSDIPGYLRLGHKDFFEYTSGSDRTIKMRMTSCYEINTPVTIFNQQWGSYNIQLNENKKDYRSEFILFSQGKDTIVYKSAAYNSYSSIQIAQKFVRKN